MKKLNFSSPLGIAITVAGLVLAFSPEARRSVRKLLVKGTAGVMDTMEQVGGASSSLLNAQSTTWKTSPTELPMPTHTEGSTSEGTETQKPDQINPS